MPKPSSGPADFRDHHDADDAMMDCVRWLGSLPPVKRRSLLLAALSAAGGAMLGHGRSASAATPDAGPRGHAATTSRQPRRGGVYRQANTTEAVTMHPFKRTDTASSAYIGLHYSGGLTRRDPDTLDHVPNMAESWELSADKRAYVWQLRKDLAWSDGKMLTTDDYLWTFQQAQNPDNKFPYRSNLEAVAEMQAPDPHKLVVTLKEPLAVGIEQADPLTPLPRHIWEKYDWNDPAKNPETFAPTVGSGPFLLKEWRRDEFARFEANPTYWRGQPLINEYLVRIVPEYNVAYELLNSGDVDYAGVNPIDYEDTKKNAALKLYEWKPAATSWQYIGFNFRRSALKDLAVRRAIAYATNRSAISRSVFYDLALPMYANFAETSWVYNPDVPRYDYDPKKAAEELENAGWKLASGAKTRSKDGQQLALKLLYGPNTSKTREQIAVITQQALGDIGIDVQVQGMEWGAYLKAIENEPFDYDLFVLGWASTIDPHWSKVIWSEASIPSLNAGAYINKEVEALYEAGSKEFDREKRKEIYQKIQFILASELPYVFLVYNLGYAFYNKRLVVNEPTRLGVGYQLEKWWIDG